jgi:low affinity Fe/Cu permease
MTGARAADSGIAGGVQFAPRGVMGSAERMSRIVTDAAGSSAAFTAALALVVGWLLTGPLFHFSDTWQLVINTSTTIVTFLMVFLIQRAQNKDARAMETKLNELIAAMEGASNRLIDIESLSEHELDTLHGHFRRLAALAQQDDTITRSHSVEEAESRHRSKHPRRAG